MKLLPITALTSLLVGCGPTYDPDRFWVVDESSATKPEAPEGEEDDEGGLSLRREQEKTFNGELVFVDGELVEGMVGFVYADSRKGGELCVVSYTVDEIEETDCGPCEQAWTLTLGPADLEIDEACEGEGFLDLDRGPLDIGVAEEVLFRVIDGEWMEVGYSEREDDVVYFDQELGGCGGGEGGAALFVLLGVGGLRRRRSR